MTLPRFLSRIADAAGPLLTGLDRSVIGERLEATTVALRIDEATVQLAGQAIGYLTAVNLAARLYPHLRLDAPAALADEAAALAEAIHPGVDLVEDGAGFELRWGAGEPNASLVTVACRGWTVELDGAGVPCGPAHGPAAMAAAAWGMGEIFRGVFARELAHGRTAPLPWVVDLITMSSDESPFQELDSVEIERVHLAGCGAIGQAAVAALAELPIGGTLIAVDDDSVDVGNLQRYLLTRAADVETPKPQLVQRALSNSRLHVEQVCSRWGDDERSGVGSDIVLVALDSEVDRIMVQAGLPRKIYNAWTQEEDIGVSRHEHFGTDEPCLACLYWPRTEKPSQSRLIAEALEQHELRIISYLVHQLSVGALLSPEQIGESIRLKRPANWELWLARPLISDVAVDFGLSEQEAVAFAPLAADQLYQRGICAGMLFKGDADRRAEEVSVPLAHQSVLAGVLLAVSFYASRCENLAAAGTAAHQIRYDLTRGGRQELAVPWAPFDRCLCRDPDFRDAYRARWDSLEPDGGS